MAQMDNTVWDKKTVPGSRVYLCIHEIPRPATPPPHTQPIPVTSPPHPNQGLPDTPSQYPNQVEVALELELIDLNVPDDIPDLIDVPKDSTRL